MKPWNERMEQLHKIDDKAKFENAYHAIMRTAEEFYNLSCNLPSALDDVRKRIHGRYDLAAYYVFDASNTFDNARKLTSLNEAYNCLFFQMSSLEYLTKTHGCTIGQANCVIDLTRKAYVQIDKWKNSVIKRMSVSEVKTC